MGFGLNLGEVGGGQIALVTVGSSDASHRLQRESLISCPPQVNSFGWVLECFIPAVFRNCDFNCVADGFVLLTQKLYAQIETDKKLGSSCALNKCFWSFAIPFNTSLALERRMNGAILIFLTLIIPAKIKSSIFFIFFFCALGFQCFSRSLNPALNYSLPPFFSNYSRRYPCLFPS